MKAKSFGTIVALLLILPILGFGQVPTPSPSPSLIPGVLPSPSPTTSPSPSPSLGPSPVPYSPDEFPVWAQDLRRAEVIAIGSFPISFLYCNLIFNLGRFGYKVATKSPDASAYAPFAPTTPVNTSDENTGLLVASISLSAAIVILDFIITQANKDK